MDGKNNAYPQQEKLLPRETGHDIGMGSPVPLSAEAVRIITRLRNMKVRVTFILYLFLFPPSRNWDGADINPCSPFSSERQTLTFRSLGLILGRGRGLEPMARCRISGQGAADTKELPTATPIATTKPTEERRAEHARTHYYRPRGLRARRIQTSGPRRTPFSAAATPVRKHHYRARRTRE